MIYKTEQFKIKSTVAEGYQLQIVSPPHPVLWNYTFKKHISRGPL